jgi:hypothetical protein
MLSQEAQLPPTATASNNQLLPEAKCGTESNTPTNGLETNGINGVMPLVIHGLPTPSSSKFSKYPLLLLIVKCC